MNMFILLTDSFKKQYTFCIMLLIYSKKLMLYEIYTINYTIIFFLLLNEKCQVTDKFFILNFHNNMLIEFK